MTDAEFIRWIRDRIVHHYGESPGTDFVLKLGEVATKLELMENKMEVQAR